MKKLKLKIESVDNKILALYTRFIINLLKAGNIDSRIIHLPKKIKRITLLKSPHVFKKAKEHFQLKKNKIVIFCSLNIYKLKSFLINRPNTIKIKVSYEQEKIA